HNHPSGDPSPSPDDVDMTRQLVEAARLLGTPLLDHVVVARGGAASLLDLGVV
ncbi:MAG: DNA repair protein RadC, partial [Myxococcales bacterium]|nr:DNA repair protein RadC [Myxococcales bacterium]